MTFKASLNGPNRSAGSSRPFPGNNFANENQILFRIKRLEKFFDEFSVGGGINLASIGDACILTRGTKHGNCVRAILGQHDEQVSIAGGASNCGSDFPILIHFHEIPVFVMRAVVIDHNEICSNKSGEISLSKSSSLEEDTIYLSEIHCYNHKICEGTLMKVTCCSRPNGANCYDQATLVGVEVHLKDEAEAGGMIAKGSPAMFSSAHIAKKLISHTFGSVLTVHEFIVISVNGFELVCTVCGIHVDRDPLCAVPAADAAMEEPYRGQICANTHFCVAAADHSILCVTEEERLPKGDLPEDVIHVTTSDGEWFPVKRLLLAPCIRLTKYVQAGKGKYKDVATLPVDERSEDAPDDGRPHCKVPIDCCTFDRVLLFILSMLYPNEKQFKLGVSEVNALADAADALGLQQLTDFCAETKSEFETRVRKGEYIRFAEVQQRNDENGELLIILDGMVLDITRWLDEHPGGPSIIPLQALNIDCTVFFEMYHASRQSFLYLKSFYIGELLAEDRIALKSSAEGVTASEAFLQSLRSYTRDWRITIDESKNKKEYKSF